MTFSYSQVSQYLRCPRSYRFRYLDVWREKETRRALFFDWCFERALAVFFERRMPDWASIPAVQVICGPQLASRDFPAPCGRGLRTTNLAIRRLNRMNWRTESCGP